jgi:hypothetical protein
LRGVPLGEGLRAALFGSAAAYFVVLGLSS